MISSDFTYLKVQSNSISSNRLLPHIRGNVGFVFTKNDLVDVRDRLTENRVRAPARAGALAPCPVDIEPQNTGLGPEKTSFFQALSIPTKISKERVHSITTSLHSSARIGLNWSKARITES